MEIAEKYVLFQFTALYGIFGLKKLVSKNGKKVRLTPYQNGHFLSIFFTLENVWKWLKMNGNSPKRRFFSIYGFLKNFLVEKMAVKKWQESKADPLRKWPYFVNFFHINNEMA